MPNNSKKYVCQQEVELHIHLIEKDIAQTNSNLTYTLKAKGKINLQCMFLYKHHFHCSKNLIEA